MIQNRKYKIDLWSLIGSITVLLYIIIVNLTLVTILDNESLRSLMEWITIPVFIAGALIPIIVIFRLIANKTDSRAIATLSLFFSLLTAVLIGYTTLV